VVTTAGNGTTDIDETPQCPGAYAGDPGFDNVYTVGSFFYNSLLADTDTAERAEFSNFGKGTVSLYAYLTMEVPAYGANNIGL
jgi:hypothetical protein